MAHTVSPKDRKFERQAALAGILGVILMTGALFFHPNIPTDLPASDLRLIANNIIGYQFIHLAVTLASLLLIYFIFGLYRAFVTRKECSQWLANTAVFVMGVSFLAVFVYVYWPEMTALPAWAADLGSPIAVASYRRFSDIEQAIMAFYFAATLSAMLITEIVASDPKLRPTWWRPISILAIILAICSLAAFGPGGNSASFIFTIILMWHLMLAMALYPVRIGK